VTRLEGKSELIKEIYQGLKLELENVDAVQLRLESENEEAQTSAINDYKFQVYISGSN